MDIWRGLHCAAAARPLHRLLIPPNMLAQAQQADGKHDARSCAAGTRCRLLKWCRMLQSSNICTLVMLGGSNTHADNCFQCCLSTAAVGGVHGGHVSISSCPRMQGPSVQRLGLVPRAYACQSSHQHGLISGACTPTEPQHNVLALYVDFGILLDLPLC